MAAASEYSRNTGGKTIPEEEAFRETGPSREVSLWWKSH
jgi:hypothetical protein